MKKMVFLENNGIAVRCKCGSIGFEETDEPNIFVCCLCKIPYKFNVIGKDKSRQYMAEYYQGELDLDRIEESFKSDYEYWKYCCNKRIDSEHGADMF